MGVKSLANLSKQRWNLKIQTLKNSSFSDSELGKTHKNLKPNPSCFIATTMPFPIDFVGSFSRDHWCEVSHDFSSSSVRRSFFFRGVWNQGFIKQLHKSETSPQKVLIRGWNIARRNSTEVLRLKFSVNLHNWVYFLGSPFSSRKFMRENEIPFDWRKKHRLFFLSKNCWRENWWCRSHPLTHLTEFKICCPSGTVVENSHFKVWFSLYCKEKGQNH